MIIIVLICMVSSRCYQNRRPVQDDGSVQDDDLPGHCGLWGTSMTTMIPDRMQKHFDNACKKHDVCYGTCANGNKNHKKKCDCVLLEDMRKRTTETNAKAVAHLFCLKID